MLPRRPIRTERLTLEPASVAHAPAMRAAIEASNGELRRWMAWAAGSTFEKSLASLAEAERGWLEGWQYGFLVTRDARLVGRIDARRTPHDPGEANLGYWTADAAAGQGYMTEAARAVVEFAFQSIGVRRLELRAHVDNVASRRVGEKIGMRREGRVRGATWMRDQGVGDAYLFGMLAADPRRDTAAATEAADGRQATAAPDFSRGLVTAVAQDASDGAVLMVAHMNEEAYGRTLHSGHAWFWSRSRERLWEKGETSGNHLVVEAVTLDCDGDSVLLTVAPSGPACHTGARSCFHNPVVIGGAIGAVDEIPQPKPRNPKSQK